MGAKSLQRTTRWTVALIYTALIFTLAWFVVPFWDWLTDTVGTEAGGNLVDRTVPALGAVVLAVLLVRYRLSSFSRYLWLLAVVAGYEMGSPESSLAKQGVFS